MGHTSGFISAGAGTTNMASRHSIEVRDSTMTRPGANAGGSGFRGPTVPAAIDNDTVRLARVGGP